MFVRRSFTIAVMLCIAIAGGAQAQQSSGGKTLVDLEAQAKAKKARTTNPTTTKSTTTSKTAAKSTARKPVARKTTSAPAPAATAPADANAAAPQQGAAAPAQAAPPDPNGPKIYKAGDIPDEWKFKKEKPAPKPAETKPATEGAEAPMAAAPAAVAPASAAPASAAPASAGPASTAPAAAAPAAAAPAAAAPAATAQSQPRQPQPAKPGTATPPARPAAKPPTKSNAQQWRDRGYISGNFGWQASSSTFSDARTLNVQTGDVEPRHLASNYDVKAGPMFDIGGGFRLWKNLGVAVAVTRYSVSKDIEIDATLPHPFLFNHDRALSGTTSGTREELAVHVDAVWVVPTKKMQIAIFGGPTFFNAKQTIVSDFTSTDTYPYDDPPRFDSAVSAEESKSVTGFNVGADVGYFFTDIFGVGGVVRFGRGTLKSSIGDLDIGGPQLSGGIRIRLRQGKGTSKPPAKTPPPPAKPPTNKKK
jgi:hypothetical protein